MHPVHIAYAVRKFMKGAEEILYVQQDILFISMTPSVFVKNGRFLFYEKTGPFFELKIVSNDKRKVSMRATAEYGS